MRTKFKTHAALIGLCVIIALTGFGVVIARAVSHPGSREEIAPSVRPVLSVVATPRMTDTLGPFAGTIEPRYSAAVGFKIFGRLAARDVNVGEVVKKGARLAALDRAPQIIAVRSAEAAVASAEARLANASATVQRHRVLLEKHVTAPAQFDVDQENLATAVATLSQAKANLTKAGQDLADTQLYADFNGVVTSRSAEIGQVLAAGQTVLTIARPDVKEAVFDIPDAMADALPPDARFDVALQLDPAVRTVGRVRVIEPEADPATRTRRVRLTLDDPPDAFRLGTTIAVSITTAVSPRIDLPLTALVEQGGKTFVWVTDPTSKAVALRAVTLAARTDTTVVITEGLAAGDRVVTAGVHSLATGQVVKVLEEAVR
jgi:membrane fusion protein, multidrug efflux system